MLLQAFYSIREYGGCPKLFQTAIYLPSNSGIVEVSDSRIVEVIVFCWIDVIYELLAHIGVPKPVCIGYCGTQHTCSCGYTQHTRLACNRATESSITAGPPAFFCQPPPALMRVVHA